MRQGPMEGLEDGNPSLGEECPGAAHTGVGEPAPSFPAFSLPPSRVNGHLQRTKRRNNCGSRAARGTRPPPPATVRTSLLFNDRYMDEPSMSCVNGALAICGTVFLPRRVPGSGPGILQGEVMKSLVSGGRQCQCTSLDFSLAPPSGPPFLMRRQSLLTNHWRPGFASAQRAPGARVGGARLIAGWYYPSVIRSLSIRALCTMGLVHYSQWRSSAGRAPPARARRYLKPKPLPRTCSIVFVPTPPAHASLPSNEGPPVFCQTPVPTDQPRERYHRYDCRYKPWYPSGGGKYWGYLSNTTALASSHRSCLS